VHAAPLPSTRFVLSAQAAYALVVGIIGLGLFASVTPSPLYARYSQLWHFSPATLTLIYATYAFGILATLLVAGRVSDQVGRRPVLLASLAALIASTGIFMTAGSAASLFVGRGLQGIATGAALSTASAAMLDFHPTRDAAGVARANAVASTAGLALGMLVSAALVQLGTAPLVVPYAVPAVLFAVALIAAWWMPEPVRNRAQLRLTVQRPTLPAVVRRPFFRASAAVFTSWSLGGVLFSLGSQLSTRVFATSNVLVAATPIVLLGGFAAIAQLWMGRAAPWLGATAGALALAFGTAVIVAASTVGSGSLLLLGSAVAGVGFGLAFLSGLRALVAVIPAQQRAGVMSAFYLVAYASLSVPAVLAGLVVRHVGFPVTFEVLGTLVSVVALALAVESWRGRPRMTHVASSAGR
jgi:MFS family permease